MNDTSSPSSEATLSGELLTSLPGGGVVSAVVFRDELGDEVLVDMADHGGAPIPLPDGGSLTLATDGHFTVREPAEESGMGGLFTVFATDIAGGEHAVTLMTADGLAWTETLAMHLEAVRIADPFAAVDALDALGLGETGDALAAVFDSLGIAPGDGTGVSLENAGEGLVVSIDTGDQMGASALLPDMALDDLAGVANGLFGHDPV
ncbi:MAG: hypothetical protein ACPGO3_10950 [Magnetospiraceae bacterium]